MTPKRVDANQGEIVDALREVGASVQTLHEVGKGCPDLVVGYRSMNFLFEVKDGNKPPSKRKLTPAEQRFFDTWRGRVWIVESATDAIQIITNVHTKMTRE